MGPFLVKILLLLGGLLLELLHALAGLISSAFSLLAFLYNSGHFFFLGLQLLFEFLVYSIVDHPFSPEFVDLVSKALVVSNGLVVLLQRLVEFVLQTSDFLADCLAGFF